MVGTITVTRKKHERKGYTRSSGVKVKKATIPKTTYETTDIGAPGQGKKIIPVRGHLPEYHINLPEKTRRSILAWLVRRYGVTKVWRRLNAQVNLRAHSENEPARWRARNIFARDRGWVAKRFGTKGLTPVAAIRKWKGMSHQARAKARGD